MNDKKIDLIAQLLAKAESTTPEEAEALTEAAEKMMVKYAIDQAVIDERRAKKGGASEKIVEVRINFTGAYRGELVHLGVCVANGLGTIKPLQYTGGTGKVFTLYLVGFESDVAQAKLLVESLQVQAAVAVRAWWKLNREIYSHMSTYDQEKARRSFVHGFGTGAGNRIFKSRTEAVQAESTGTELVLVSRREKVTAHVAAAYNVGHARARTATGRDGAAASGYQAGQQANTGGKSVGQGRGITA
jgi:hypothetical protein